MSHDGWKTVLILGGIRSGKSAYAESLVADAQSVLYVATSATPPDDTGFAARIAAHQQRRPQSWTTVETGGQPYVLVQALAQASEDDTVLVDDLGGWAAGLLGSDGAPEQVAVLAEAVRTCPARVVLVSPEVGLSVVPTTELGNEFADLVGDLNQAVAAACDTVVLVVAGQPSLLKAPAPAPAAAEQVGAQAAASAEQAGAPAAPAPQESPEVITPTATAPQPSEALTGRTMALPIMATGLVIQPGMELPIPDDDARERAKAYLSLLNVAGSGLGKLTETVLFAAGTQGRTVPEPWQRPRLLLLHGNHEGDVAAGQSPSRAARVADGVRQGTGPIGLLAAEHGVSLQVVDAATAGYIEFAEATTVEAVEAALRHGWRLADEAVDSGVDLLILGSCGAGAEAAAAAIVSAMTGAEIAGLLARVVSADGTVDDAAWMLRCAAVRDALHRVHGRVLAPRELLQELGGADIAIGTGIILGATARRTPVLLDGPVGTAAALVARDLGSQSRLWCALPDHGQHPTTVLAADVLGTTPLVDLKVGLGEGATSLLALPLLRAALTLSASLPTLPPVLAQPPAHALEPEFETTAEADFESRQAAGDDLPPEPEHETDQPNPPAPQAGTQPASPPTAAEDTRAEHRPTTVD